MIPGPPPRVPRFVAFDIHQTSGNVIALDDRGDLWISLRDVYSYGEWRPLPMHPDRTIPAP